MIAQSTFDFWGRPTSRHRSRRGEIIIDSFAGGGGASMGIEWALGRCVDLAINHDERAITMHEENHPHTRHIREDIWKVDPIGATDGRDVGLLWASPDCKHFSRAKGAKPVEKKIRSLAWVVISWAKRVRPRVIILENVREFADWGPLTEDHRPCKARKGLTFRRWVGRLRALGYVVEWRVLNAADYGAPTHRRRLFLIARRDGRPIRWPDPTHGPGRNKPWRTAAECIEWSLPCPSIFLTKEEGRKVGCNRPLAEKTMRRIAHGLKRYVLDAPKPFIVAVRDSAVDAVRKAKEYLAGIEGPVIVPVNPFIAGVGGRMGQTQPAPVDQPSNTITAKNDRAIVCPSIVPVTHMGDRRIPSAEEPLPTITSAKRGEFAVVAPYVAECAHGETGRWGKGASDIDAPLGTIHAGGKNHAIVSASLMKFRGDSAGASVDDPMPTVTSGQGSIRPAGATHALGVMAANLIHYHDEKTVGEARASSVEDPLPTQTTENRFGLVSSFVSQYFGNGVIGRPVEEPLPTVTAWDHNAIVAAHMTQFYGRSVGDTPEVPTPTQSERDHTGVVAANLVHMNHGEKQWSAADEPLRTVTTGGNHAAVVAFLLKYFGTAIGQHLSEPLHTVTSKPRFAIVQVDGVPYAIADIGMRMLTPRELARAQGFPEEYRLLGTKARQVAAIGNSVCPIMAKVLVQANYKPDQRPTRRTGKSQEVFANA